MSKFDLESETKSEEIRIPAKNIFSRDLGTNPEVRKNDLELRIIEEILGYNLGHDCGIQSRNGNLCLIHYANGSEHRYPSARGLVFDIKNKVTIAGTYGYIDTLTVQDITCHKSHLEVMFTSPTGHLHTNTYSTDKWVIAPGFEGTTIRVFKHAGKVYHSNHRSLFADKFRCGNSPNFLEIFRFLGGPQNHELFDTEKDYSSYCYFFILVHPELMFASHLDVGSGFLVYMGYKQMYTDNPFAEVPDEQVSHCNYFEDNYTKFSDSFAPRDDPFIYKLHYDSSLVSSHIPLSNSESLTKIRNKYNILLPGEFLFLVKLNDSKQPETYIRLQSVSYSRRLAIQGNQQDIYRQFCRLTDGLSIKPEQRTNKQFREYPLVRLKAKVNWLDIPSLIKSEYLEQGRISYSNYFEATNNYLILHTRVFRNEVERKILVIQIWLNLLCSLPPKHIPSLFDILENYYTDRENLLNWLYNEFINVPNSLVLEHDIIHNIYTHVHDFTEQNILHNNQKFSDLFRRNLKITIYRQKTNRFFKLMSIMKEFQNKIKIEDDNFSAEEISDL